MDCIFCKIANGEIPTNMVYQDERVAAFHDMNPQAKTHILIVPKSHAENAANCAEKYPGTLEHMIKTAKKIAQDLGMDGYRIVMNTGKVAGQTVFHFHMHILGGEQLSDHMA
ncbi:MAG: histidine triad nucleotide-binding protein [Christensenellales bacterium]|jgi:histidine triad (HIT) family protein